MEQKAIGRIIATQNKPTSVDNFAFWTDSKLILNPFDIVKVEHVNPRDPSKFSYSYGVIEDISHITDAASFLTNYISSDFGDVDIVAPTLRVGMNYVDAKVVCNNMGVYIPLQSDAKVYLADRDEIEYALGLDNKNCKLPCGYLEMYENSGDEQRITLPVKFDPRFVIGPEGAHLNISGISGLAAKTSYAMFLLKAIQDSYLNHADDNLEQDDSAAFVLFNVKGKDLMGIHLLNDFKDGGKNSDEQAKQEKEKAFSIYEDLKLTPEPFKNVRYFVPNGDSGREAQNTFLLKSELDEYMEQGIAKQFVFTYEGDKDDLDLFFSNVDDSNQTIDAIQEYIIAGQGGFNSVNTWSGFLDLVSKHTDPKESPDIKKEIPVVSWRKFRRIISKTLKNSPLFENRAEGNTIRLEEQLQNLQPNDVYVIDVAHLSEIMQGFVFGDVVRIINRLQQGDYDEQGATPPKKVVVFIDELNKYASTDTPKNSPILRQILDVTERGRSLGVVLFGAEQFRSAIHDRVKGNCSTHAYGRTNAIEATKADYKVVPATYKNILTRLDQGEYLLQNPIFRSMLKIKFPKPIYKQFKQ
ncbi:ATP-binding protein [Ruminococcaceae bacterium OttesenSCG-928-L11]|nr:ATP-binding protein [Ruminococcaceae bacterium OttesenSCG-928-L11]